MPSLRPFRALRYAASIGPDLSAVVCPPYDIIPAELDATLRDRDPHNAVRVELPSPEPGGPPDTRYGVAARILAQWRSDGVLIRDRQPSVYIHEMAWDARNGRSAGRARGVFARLRLEPFGPMSGVRRHERTMSGPKEDRYRLLTATQVNLSPVVLLADATPGVVGGLLDRMTTRDADVTAVTDNDVRHRLWICLVETDADGRPRGDPCTLLEALSARPLTIADGHHRYETALRHRDERDQGRPDEGDPAWAYTLALVYDVAEAPPVLPTHRVLLTGPDGATSLGSLKDLVDVQRLPDPAAVLATMAEPDGPVRPDATGTGRIGLVSDGVAAILRVRPDAFASIEDPATSAASRGLDVVRLAVMLERLGVDAAALAAGDRLRYVKDASDAVGMVVRGEGVAAFLLDGPPVSAVTRVAAAGEVMPQKSTFFDPKAPTGLVFGPLEW